MFKLEKAIMPKPQKINNLNKDIKIGTFRRADFKLVVTASEDIVNSAVLFGVGK